MPVVTLSVLCHRTRARVITIMLEILWRITYLHLLLKSSFSLLTSVLLLATADFSSIMSTDILLFSASKVATVPRIDTRMGDSRKYPYHTTDGFSEFRGQGGVLRTGNPKAWGDTYEWNSEGMGGGV